MSRGPGVWQRVILQAVADGSWHYLADLLLPGYTKAEYNALNRAMHQLVQAERISAYWWQFGGAHQRFVAVGPPGTVPPKRDEIRAKNRLSVGRVPCGDLSNTYAPGSAS